MAHAKLDMKRPHRLQQHVFSSGKRFLGIFLYLWLVFGLFNAHEYIVLAQHQLDFNHFGWALVNAFILAKVMMVAEELHLADHFVAYPLISRVLINSLVFAIVLIAFHFIEAVISGMWRGETFVESLPGVGGGGLIGLVLVSLIVAITLIPFFALRAIRMLIGGPQLHRLFFLRGHHEVLVEIKPAQASAASAKAS